MSPDVVNTSTKVAPRHAHIIEVRLKPEFPDSTGAHVLRLLHGLNLYTAKDVRAARLYSIKGPLNLGHAQQAARELLCDAVTEEFRLITQPAPNPNGQSHWRVEVWLKTSVTDPVGETVHAALIELGLPTPDVVRCGAVYHITGKCPRGQLEKTIARCVANPVIHDFSVVEAHS